MHQHIFKVGWLLTRNFQTTTILYYTFFLPGILLHEVIYWLVAGILDVHADRAIKFPEAQEIGELKLNFVTISRRTSNLKKAVISGTPLIIGLVIMWWIANRIFDISTIFDVASTGSLKDVAEAVRLLLSAPDFWIWFYLAFTISNTMFSPTVSELKGWWIRVGSLVVVAFVLLLVFIGNQFLNDVVVSFGELLDSVSLLFLILISINIVVTVILGTIESVVERITGYSATFQRGKMITMTRAEAIDQKEREKQRLAQQQQREARRKPQITISSVYMLTLPIPGTPGQEPVTQEASVVLGIQEQEALPKGSTTPTVIDPTPEKSEPETPQSLGDRITIHKPLGLTSSKEEVSTDKDTSEQKTVAQVTSEATEELSTSTRPTIPEPKKSETSEQPATPLTPSPVGDKHSTSTSEQKVVPSKKSETSERPAISLSSSKNKRSASTSEQKVVASQAEKRSISTSEQKVVPSKKSETSERPAISLSSSKNKRSASTSEQKVVASEEETSKPTKTSFKPPAPPRPQSNPFGQSKPNLLGKKSDNEAETDNSSPFDRLQSPSKPPSRTPKASTFNESPFGRKASQIEDDNDDELDEDEESIRRPAVPKSPKFSLGSRLGKPVPKPKPFNFSDALGDKQIEDDDDELDYEDLHDELVYEDDEDTIYYDD